jgi:Outer membrane efflux protein
VLTFMGAAFPTGSSVTPATGAPPMSTSLLDAPLDVIGELRAEPLAVSFSLDELRQAALETRPDVQAAQRGIDTAQRNLDLAYVQRHRDIDVALEYQRIGGDNTVGATVSFPLFLSHKFESQINQGLAQVQQAGVALDQAKLQAIAELRKPIRPINRADRSSRSIPQKRWRKRKNRFASLACPTARAPRVCSNSRTPSVCSTRYALRPTRPSLTIA